MQDLVPVVGVVHRVDSTPHLLPPQEIQILDLGCPLGGAFVEFCAFALLYQPCPGDNIEQIQIQNILVTQVKPGQGVLSTR
jgi:hypothetical protein